MRSNPQRVCSHPARRSQGARPDEALDLDLALPFSPAQASQAPAAPAAAPPPPPAAAQQPRRSPLAGLGDLLPVPRFGAQKLLPAGGASGASAAPAGAAEPAGGADSDGGGHFALRCGQLLISAEARRPPCGRPGLRRCTSALSSALRLLRVRRARSCKAAL